jgi:hypothetical protein
METKDVREAVDGERETLD